MKRGRIWRRAKNQDCHGLLMGSKEADILQDYSQCWIENTKFKFNQVVVEHLS